jgi:Flp pilus assembly pilin Flp
VVEGFTAAKNSKGGNGKMKTLIMKLWKEEQGQDLVEYALLLTLIALVAGTTIKNVGTTLNAIFTNANSSLTSAS